MGTTTNSMFEATLNSISTDEKFNDALNSILTIAEYSKIHQYKVDECSDIIGHILTYQSSYANKPISEKEVDAHVSKKEEDIRYIRIYERAHCTHTNKDGSFDRALSVVKIDDKVWFKCNLCNALIDMDPPSNFAPVVSRVKQTICSAIVNHNAECMEKGIDEPIPEIYSLLDKDATTMYNINVELKRMLKAKRHKASSKKKPPFTISKTILE